LEYQKTWGLPVSLISLSFIAPSEKVVALSGTHPAQCFRNNAGQAPPFIRIREILFCLFCQICLVGFPTRAPGGMPAPQPRQKRSRIGFSLFSYGTGFAVEGFLWGGGILRCHLSPRLIMIRLKESLKYFFASPVPVIV